MAILLHINTKTSPSWIIADIREKIKAKLVDTWICDEDGDFTHSPDQWVYHAWLRPEAKDGDNKLSFWFLGNNKETMTKRMYGIYHGRFMEMLLTYYDDFIDDIKITSQKYGKDNF